MNLFLLLLLLLIKKIIKFTYPLRLVICHLWYRFSIDTDVLHSGIVPKPKLWYRAIPSSYKTTLQSYLHNYKLKHKL